MRFPFFYKKTPQIEDQLKRLEIAKRVIDLLPQLPHIEENIRRQSLLKSSLFSARIEGNPLTLTDIQFADETKAKEEKEKLEIFNLFSAYRWLYFSKTPKKVTKKLILKLHKRVMKNLTGDPPGLFRQEVSAIFNPFGVAIYIPPPPRDVPVLIDKLIDKTNSLKIPAPVKTALFHFSFEKIHPFIDGNGRVGRLLSFFILHKEGYGFKGLVSLEEYLEKNRQQYYDLLAISKKDITAFVEFFLKGIANQAEKTISQLRNRKKELPEDSLLPKRREILEIVKTHKTVSFNFIKRRFLKVKESTLHYDLQQLIKGGFIRKLGSTRGVVYAPI